jgi:hypothetical protein
MMALHGVSVGFGDICPGKTGLGGGIFLTILPLLGLGFFCGPVLSMASFWKNEVPGGVLSLATVTLVLGVSVLTTVEEMSLADAIHLSVITGRREGFLGDICRMKLELLLMNP